MRTCLLQDDKSLSTEVHLPKTLLQRDMEFVFLLFSELSLGSRKQVTLAITSTNSVNSLTMYSGISSLYQKLIFM